MKNPDEKFMAQALALARLGGRSVAPNPMVGAVIVKDGSVIGQGYHQKFGGPHAEVNAIRSVKTPDDLRGATIYVTLEPCRHYGKTPPCLDLIEEVGIVKIVCGSRDPFQQKFEVRSSKLEIEFLKGRIAEQCRQLNKFFFTWIEKKRPFVTVKIAMSADGFVAGRGGKPIHLTTPAQDREAHHLRAFHQAIMVGINTVLNDDPQLTVRLVKGQDPLRVILDPEFRIPKRAKVLADSNHLIATTLAGSRRAQPQADRHGASKSNFGKHIWVSPTKKWVSLKKLLVYLAKQGISSVLAETGPTLYKTLKRQKLIDELIIYRSPKKLTQGLRLFL